MPATVQTILGARIDRLPAEEKQLLQAASVIGEHLPYALLAAIAEQPEDKLRRGLAHLQEAEFLYETQLFPDLEYTFKHALTHEVTYDSVLHDAGGPSTLGSSIEIERLHPDRLSEHIDQLAHHASRGEMWDEAAASLREAGLKALARSAVPDAAHFFGQALLALEHLPESPVRNERAIDLAFDLRTALLPLGDLQRISERLTTAEALAKAIGDRRRLGMISVYLCVNSYLICDHDRALAAAEQATTCGDVGTETVGTIYRTLTHSHRLYGWLILESASVSYGKATSYLPVIDLVKGYFKLQDRDDFREVREKVMGKLLALDEALKPTVRHSSRTAVGARRLGESRRSAERLREAEAIAQRLADDRRQGQVDGFLIHAHSMRGSSNEALVD